MNTIKGFNPITKKRETHITNNTPELFSINESDETPIYTQDEVNHLFFQIDELKYKLKISEDTVKSMLHKQKILDEISFNMKVLINTIDKEVLSGE